MRKQQPSVAHKSFFLSHRSYAPTKLSEPPDHSRKPLEKENCNTGSSNTFHRAYDDSALSPEQIAWKRPVLRQPDDIVSFAETGNGNTQRAKIINAVDEYLCEHKDLWFSNVVPRRVDDYWVCFWQLMEYGEIKKTPGQVHQDSMAYGLNLREAVLFTR